MEINYLLQDQNLNSKIVVVAIISLLLLVFIVFFIPLGFKDTSTYKYFPSPIFKSVVPNTLLLSIIFPTFTALKTVFLSYAYA